MKETRAARDARRRRNKAKRDAAKKNAPPSGVSYREAMVRQRVEAKRQAKAKAYAKAYSEVLMAVSKEYYDGEVRYGTLRAKEPQVGAECKLAVEQALGRHMAIPKGEQTPEDVAEAADIVQELHQQWIDEGKLVPQNLRLWEVPQARMYKDGRVEAVNRVRDMDMKDMGTRFLKAMEKVDLVAVTKAREEAQGKK